MKLLLATLIFAISYAQTEPVVGLLNYDPEKAFPGYNLHFPHHQGTAYLLNNCGEIVHKWEDSAGYKPGSGVQIHPNGNLYVLKGRGADSNTYLHANGGGEKMEIRDWDNNVLWSWSEYNTEEVRLHHDFDILPNGNIILIAWEVIDYDDAIQAGRDPSKLVDNELWPDKIIEIEMVGNSEANIVWEWRFFDHIVQDIDPSKENYGVISENPGKININLDEQDGIADWLHCNSLSYNADRDQIVISCPHMDEIYLIDHSLAMEEAKTAAGDFLWRWGKPTNYGRGSSDDQRLSFPHDAHWVDIELESDHPDYGKIAVFSNRAGDDYSSVHLVTVGSTYEFTPDSQIYEPEDPSWSYTAPIPQDMYSRILSSIQRLQNGNTLICSGAQGWTFEIDPEGNKVWEYKNPMIFGTPIASTDSEANLSFRGNIHFRMYRYSIDYPAFAGKTLTPMGYIEEDPINYCDRFAEETTTTTTTEPSECACYAEIEMLVDTLRSDLQTQLGDELRVQIPAGILAEFQDMSEEFSSTLTPIIAEQLTERIPDAVEQAFRNMSSVLSQQLVSTLQPLFLQVENFTNMPDDLKEALTTSLADEFVPISALQTIFESLEESLRTSLSSGLSSVLDEYYVSKEDLADMPAQMQEDLQNSLSPYFMAMADMEDLANLDVNLGSALAETLPNIFATKEEVDSLSATVSMLEMDNNEVITGMSDMASCMADIAGSMGSDDGSDDTPIETAAPTEYWETLGRLMESGPNKCSTSSSDRAFRLVFTTLDNCLKRCSEDSRCQYASTNFMTGTDPMYCIGCIDLTQTADDWMAYEMLNNRRQLSSVKQLSEVERLRAENQGLRSELAEARRN